MWIGRLADSALATATAVFALSRIDATAHRKQIELGLKWLAEHQNCDGGFGDTPRSASNISTTLLAWSAFTAGDDRSVDPAVIAAVENRIRQFCGSLDAADIVAGVRKRYGKDRTFAVPILVMCSLAGRLGDAMWQSIPRLPYEMAILPRGLFKWLRLGVVSYALPALIAIGQAIDYHRKGTNPFLRFLRKLTQGPTLRLLEAIQPESGGFLEATPLTAFVTMSLASMGLKDHPVVRRGEAFLTASMRPDGAWPIDTDLSTWITTLSVRSIEVDGISIEDRRLIAEGLLRRQEKGIHPYTAAVPGGWSWTDKSGGVPDADDTAGAVAALWRLRPDDDRVPRAVIRGMQWLMGVQNSDGGIATFCRGWGKLQFDRSAADLTAHALAAWGLWLDRLPRGTRRQVDLSMRRALAFLLRSQKSDGSWDVLWFGNERAAGENNFVFGTARVLGYLCELPERFFSSAGLWIGRAMEYLIRQQDESGGWGAHQGIEPSIEETAVTMDALSRVYRRLGNIRSAQSVRTAKATTSMLGVQNHGNKSRGFQAMGDNQRQGEEFAEAVDEHYLSVEHPPRTDPSDSVFGGCHPDGAWPTTRIDDPNIRSAIQKGVRWLMEKTENGTRFEPAPIGLYFARLWYYEELYPVIFALGAMNQAKSILPS